jgi:hypothetical protein
MLVMGRKRKKGRENRIICHICVELLARVLLAVFHWSTAPLIINKTRIFLTSLASREYMGSAWVLYPAT